MLSKTIFAFPGQGSQFLNMGKGVFDKYQISKAVFQEVDDALGYKLSEIIFGSSQEELTLTYNAQPALMCVSITVLRALEQETGKKINDLCGIVCGHSLGEYSALCAAGAISLEDTAKILAIRGKAMYEAAPNGSGSMAAIIGATDEQISQLLKNATNEGEILAVANDNSFGQTVISGSTSAIERSIEVAKTMGIKRAVRLPVSGPFHSPLMQPAKEKMQEALKNITIKSPIVPVIANYTAKSTKNPEEIRDLLTQQVTGSVRWRESVMHAESLGYTKLFEIGAGKVLTGLTKRISENITAHAVETPEDIEAIIPSL